MVLSVLVAFVLTLLGSGQQPTGQKTQPFKSGVELVQVTVTASDAAGNDITDLKAEDFEIFER